MVKKRGLHRGLDALIARSDHSIKKEVGELQQDGELKDIPVEFLRSGVYQPRKVFEDDGLEELAASIRAQGIIQPIVVRKKLANQYEIIAGERRWRAAQKAGLHNIPCIIKDIPDEAAIAMSLIENIQREDLNPIEEAMALRRLMNDFGLTQQQAADAVGKSRTALTNLLRLLGLSSEVKDMLERGDIEMGHARALLTLGEADQKAAAKTCRDKGFSVRETERYVRKLLTPKVQVPPASQQKDVDIKRLETKISEKIGAPTQIQHGVKGRGKIIIEYSNVDVLDGILSHLAPPEE